MRSRPATATPFFNNNLTFDSRLFSATFVRTFNSSVVNELRLAYRNTRNDFPLVGGGDFSGLGAFSDPLNFPNISVSSLGFNLGPNGDLPQGGFDYNYQLFDTLTLIRGRHSFKFGADIRNLIFTSFFLPRGRGDYVYADR